MNGNESNEVDTNTENLRIPSKCGKHSLDKTTSMLRLLFNRTKCFDSVMILTSVLYVLFDVCKKLPHYVCVLSAHVVSLTLFFFLFCCSFWCQIFFYPNWLSKILREGLNILGNSWALARVVCEQGVLSRCRSINISSYSERFSWARPCSRLSLTLSFSLFSVGCSCLCMHVCEFGFDVCYC